MSDRQYLSSVAISATVVVVALGGIVSVAFWLGWGGAAGLLMIVAGFLAWFYWGPRPDLQSMGRGDDRDQANNA